MADDLARRIAEALEAKFKIKAGKIAGFMDRSPQGTLLYRKAETDEIADAIRAELAPLLAGVDAVLAADWDDITEEPAVLTDKYIAAMNALRAAREGRP